MLVRETYDIFNVRVKIVTIFKNIILFVFKIHIIFANREIPWNTVSWENNKNIYQSPIERELKISIMQIFDKITTTKIILIRKKSLILSLANKISNWNFKTIKKRIKINAKKNQNVRARACVNKHYLSSLL